MSGGWKKKLVLRKDKEPKKKDKSDSQEEVKKKKRIGTLVIVDSQESVDFDIEDDVDDDIIELDAPTIKSPKRKKDTKATTKKRKHNTSEYIWAQHYAPTSESDLLVNNKKLEEVKTWINQQIIHKKPRSNILLLVGPPGCGKTTMIDVLLKKQRMVRYEHDVNNEEWNPEERVEHRQGYQSKLKHFAEFLDQSSRFKPLLLVSEPDRNKSFVVVNELPFVRQNSAQQKERHEILLKLLHGDRNPVIIIHHVYESSTIYANIWNNYPPEFTNSPKVTRIDINPMIKKNIVSTLNHIKEKEHINVTKDEIEYITNNADGDLRQAIQQLQFHGTPQETTQKKKKRKLNSDTEPTRDAYVDLFHATGRVLHAKRLEDGTLERDLENDVLNKIHAQENNQINYLYENYLKFSNTDIDAVQQCIEKISLADTFAHFGDDVEDRQFFLYSFLIANRGYQYHNQNNILTGKWLNVNAPKIRSVLNDQSTKKHEIAKRIERSLYYNHAHTEEAFMGEIVPYLTTIQRRNPVNPFLKAYHLRGTATKKETVGGDDSKVEDTIADDREQEDNQDSAVEEILANANGMGRQTAGITHQFIDEFPDSE